MGQTKFSTVFGFSFSEIVLIGVVTLVAVGPQRLPGTLHKLGKWIKDLKDWFDGL